MWGLLALWAGVSVVAASFFGLWSLLRNEGKAVDDHEGRDNGATEGRWQ